MCECVFSKGLAHCQLSKDAGERKCVRHQNRVSYKNINTEVNIVQLNLSIMKRKMEVHYYQVDFTTYALCISWEVIEANK